MLSNHIKKKITNHLNEHKFFYENKNFYLKMCENKTFYNDFLNKYIFNQFGPLFIESQSNEDVIAVRKFILFVLKNYYENDITIDKNAYYAPQGVFNSIFIVTIECIKKAFKQEDKEAIFLINELKKKYPKHFHSYYLNIKNQ